MKAVIALALCAMAVTPGLAQRAPTCASWAYSDGTVRTALPIWTEGFLAGRGVHDVDAFDIEDFCKAHPKSRFEDAVLRLAQR